MRYKPFCIEHGIRIHDDGFVYYNGPSMEDLITATRRNLPFHGDYYVAHFFKQGNKVESKRLCHESSEDAVSYNVFTEMLSNGHALRKLTGHIIGREISGEIDLYLWGGRIDLKNNIFEPYQPLLEVRKMLEPGRKGPPKPPTEPDIMLIIPKKLVILIEAKFGSKNPTAEDETKQNRKRRTAKELIADYCGKNTVIDCNEIFDFNNIPRLFYEQIFRNIVFAATMAKLEGAPAWYVVNLRNQHIMNIRRGQPESMPIMRNIRSILQPKHKKRFIHMTWEQIYDVAIKENEQLYNLASLVSKI
jgi:hypothetical protein